MKLYETLEKQLKNEPNYVTDNGELKKWVVINKAQNFDAELIDLLLKDKDIKDKFFVDVKGILVFNQNLFVQFLEQKNYLNDSYTQYKNKVGLTIDGKYLKQRNEVTLVWPFKDCVLEGGQSREEDKREEIFFNEILAQNEINQLLEPKVLTNTKTYTKDGEQSFTSFTRDAELNKKRGLPENTITDNLIIKGNNLLALHSLKKEFAGKVKLIYIDPPYNTENDSFKYNDSFNHSTWLSFMKNRLEIAKDLLKKEKEFVKMFARRFEHLDKKLKNIYLIRNEREVKIIDKLGRAFEPDFILFCKQKKGEELTYQVFIEPKGNHLVAHDKWKEDFLKEIRNEQKTITIDTDKYLITGVPFYNNANENEFKETLETTLNEYCRCL